MKKHKIVNLFLRQFFWEEFDRYVETYFSLVAEKQTVWWIDEAISRQKNVRKYNLKALRSPHTLSLLKIIWKVYRKSTQQIAHYMIDGILRKI